jgi:hypothetical protein
MDWSKSRVVFSSGGRPAVIFGRAILTRLTMSSVEAEAALRIVSSAARWPLMRTIFCWIAKPSWT